MDTQIIILIVTAIIAMIILKKSWDWICWRVQIARINAEEAIQKKKMRQLQKNRDYKMNRERAEEMTLRTKPPMQAVQKRR